MIALLVFGPKRLPELARQVGRGIRELKAQANSISGDLSAAVHRDSDREDETPGAAGPAAAHPSPTVIPGSSDDDLLDGVVVSGATGPPPPAES